MSYFGFEIAPQNNMCECYKKLQFLGVPLYKNEENEEYAEGLGGISYENCFQLPGVLRINAQITEYPIVNDNKLPVIFGQMAQVIPNLSDFELNVLSFWILDLFVEGLWTAQKSGMNYDHQRATLLWIAYLFNYIQKENPSRKELFAHLKMVLFAPPDLDKNEYSGEELREELSDESTTSASEPLRDNPTSNVTWELPLPPGTIGIATESDLSPTDELTFSDDTDLSEINGEDVKSINTAMKKTLREETVSERNVRHMKIILEILYRIFGRLWVFLETQTVFHAMPSLEQVDLPFKFNIPKPAPKVDPFAVSKAEKFGRKMSATEGSNQEMELEKQLHKNDYILPLQAAEESKVYIKQVFPQPPSDRSIFSKGKEKKKPG